MKRVANILARAKCPEDIFGDDPAVWEVAKRRLQADSHPDTNGNTAEATEVFQLLGDWILHAQRKIDLGTYGDRKPVVTAVVRAKSGSWELCGLLRKTPVTSVYEATDGSEVHVVNNPRDNDLLDTEQKVIKAAGAWLAANHPNGMKIAELRASCLVPWGKGSKRRINVLSSAFDGAISLRQLKDGKWNLDARHMGWIFNRMIDFMHTVHSAGYTHNAINPDTFHIVPSTHVGWVGDWTCAVEKGSKAKVADSRWKSLYPERVFKGTVDHSTDIHQAAHSVAWLMGGSIDSMPDSVPRRLCNVLRACRIAAPHGFTSAEELHFAWAEALEACFGPPKFIELQKHGSS